jgi:hypothetical protein
MMKVEACLAAFTKNQLYQIEPKEWPKRIVIAKDYVTKDKKPGSKRYYWFENLDVFIHHLGNSKESWYYEIIDDSQATCMYFDIEWYHNCGTFKTAEHVIQTILEEYSEFSKLAFGEEYVTKPRNWKILCSTGNAEVLKFSYHLIDRSGFEINNSRDRKTHACNFSAYLMKKESLLRLLLSKSKETCLPIDLSVYARWQNFRTIRSSKIKSDRFLLPVNLNGDPVEVNQEESKLYFATFCPDLIGRTIEQDVVFPKDKKNSTNKICSAIYKHSYTPDLYWESNIKIDPKTLASSLDNNGSIEFYLNCIPNSGDGQHWDIYFTVAAAVHRARGSLQIFCKWAEKSEKYSQDEAERLWNSLDRQNRIIGYNGGTLRKIAKFCSPAAFETTTVDFRTSMSLECYSSEFMRLLPMDKSVIVCQSPMGSGKTYGMTQFISRIKPSKVLILSSRLTYTENAINDINQRLVDDNIHFQSYLDVNNSFSKVRYLVIQMESIYKLEDIEFDYDLLLIDESEACLKQFNSATMTSRRDMLWKNLSVFKKLFVNAKRKVLLDAFISNRSIDFVESMQETTANSVVLVNTKLLTERTAIQYKHEKAWLQTILDEISKGKKVIIFWGSKAKGADFEAYLTGHYKTAIKVKYYHSDQCDKDGNSDLGNVRESWKDIDVLMYTSKITVGVNFDEKDVFDSIFVYATSNGCSARDVIQASMRVRHLKDNKLHFYINGFHDKTKIDIANLKYRMAIKNQMTEELDDELTYLMPDNQSHLHRLHLKWHSEEKWLVHLYLQNELEQKESNLHFNSVFRKFLTKSGYVIEYYEKDCEFSIKSTSSVEYKVIPTIDQIQFDILQQHLTNNLTMMQKLSISKYFFRKTLLPHVNLEIESSMWQIWTLKPNVIKNIKQELTQSALDIFNKDKLKIGLKSFMPRDSIMLDKIQSLFKILKLENSLDTRTLISAREIAALISNQDMLSQIGVAFDKNSSKNYNKKQALGLVNSVLKTWCEGKLVVVRKSRKQVGKINFYDYLFENTIENQMSETCNSAFKMKDIFNFGKTMARNDVKLVETNGKVSRQTELCNDLPS